MTSTLTRTHTFTETIRERLHRRVMIEQDRAAEKHGDQRDVPLGFGDKFMRDAANRIREACDKAFKEGRGTWRHIIREEVYESFAEDDPQKALLELIQAAAMCHSAAEALLHQHPDLTLPPPF